MLHGDPGLGVVMVLYEKSNQRLYTWMEVHHIVKMMICPVRLLTQGIGNTSLPLQAMEEVAAVESEVDMGAEWEVTAAADEVEGGKEKGL